MISAYVKKGLEMKREIYYDPIRIARVILARRKKVLLVLSKRGWWEFPGGKLERSETYAQAAVRELKEETCLDLISLTLFRVMRHDVRWRRRDHHETRYLKHYFLATKIKGWKQIQPQEKEISEIRWCSQDEASQLLANNLEHLQVLTSLFTPSGKQPLKIVNLDILG